MTQYTSPHDEPWFSDPDQPWGGSHKRIERDPDEERDRRIDDALTETPSTHLLSATLQTFQTFSSA